MIKKLLVFQFLLGVGIVSVNAQEYKTLESVQTLEYKGNSDLENSLKYGIQLMEDDKNDAAISTFDSVLNVDADNIPAIFNKGVAYYAKSDLVSAEKQFDKALSINKAIHWAWFGKGMINLDKYLPELAIKNLYKAKVLDKDNVQYTFFYGIALKESRDFANALVAFKEIENKEHDYNPEVYLEMGNIYALHNDYENAELYYTKAKESGASEKIVALNQAKISSNDSDQSVIKLDAFIAENPDDANGYVIRGNHYLKNNEFNNAINDFSSALQINEKQVPALNGRGAAYINIADYENAIQDLNLAINESPNYAKAYFNRGIAKEMVRDVKGACADWEQAFFLGINEAEKFLNSPTCDWD